MSRRRGVNNSSQQESSLFSYPLGHNEIIEIQMRRQDDFVVKAEFAQNMFVIKLRIQDVIRQIHLPSDSDASSTYEIEDTSIQASATNEIHWVKCNNLITSLVSILSRTRVPQDNNERLRLILNLSCLARSMKPFTAGGKNRRHKVRPILIDIKNVRVELSAVNKMVPATVSSIETLEKVKFEKGLSNMEECRICLDRFQDGVQVSRMPCQYIFHGDCITTWLKTSHFCPLCRFIMPS